MLKGEGCRLGTAERKLVSRKCQPTLGFIAQAKGKPVSYAHLYVNFMLVTPNGLWAING